MPNDKHLPAKMDRYIRPATPDDLHARLALDAYAAPTPETAP